MQPCTRVGALQTLKKKDFDLIFFHTEEYPYKIVQDACSSYWCHVALVLLLTDKEIEMLKQKINIPINHHHHHHYNDNDNDVDDDNDDDNDIIILEKKRKEKKRVYILESTTDCYPCAVTGISKSGVKLCLLSKRLEGEMEGICGYKSVTKYKKEHLNSAKQILLHELIPQLLGTPYEKNLMRLGKAWVHYMSSKFWWCHCAYSTTNSMLGGYDESSMFCTELITHVFTRLGLLTALHGVKTEMLNQSTNRYYTDEDLVLEDYVYLENDFLQKDSWLTYGPLKIRSFT